MILRTLITSLLIAMLAIPAVSIAGGHIQTWPAKPDIQLDPNLRSEVTGTVLVTGANRGIGLQTCDELRQKRLDSDCDGP